MLFDRFRRGWNAFKGRDPTDDMYYSYFGTSGRPDRVILRTSTARSVISALYNRIAMDAAQIDIRCCKITEDNKFDGFVNSPLDECLSRNANIDQTGRAMIKDLVLSLFDEGSIAAVPVVCDGDPRLSDSFDINEIRIGKITQWYPYHVIVELFNEEKGMTEQVQVDKRWTTIIENPFYPVMNAPNSTYQRLNKILNDIDRINGTVVSGKLDMIIQMPYSARSEVKRNYAEKRREDIETQLVKNKHGIAYMDASEKVVQLNRPLDNNLWEQSQELMKQLFNQLGVSQAVFEGTADETQQLNYYNSTIEPILSAITEEMERKWITKTAYSQGKRIKFFRSPFKLVPVNNIAEIADKFTRNEIMTSNEIRGVIGMAPSNDPKADMLINSNLNQEKGLLAEKSKNIQNEDNS